MEELTAEHQTPAEGVTGRKKWGWPQSPHKSQDLEAPGVAEGGVQEETRSSPGPLTYFRKPENTTTLPRGGEERLVHRKT